MKATIDELETLVCNCELNDYMRSIIGGSLCKVIYDSANSPDDYPGDYNVLYDATFYNCPSDVDILLCLNYIREVSEEDHKPLEIEF